MLLMLWEVVIGQLVGMGQLRRLRTACQLKNGK
jgi:hypothetical protein